MNQAEEQALPDMPRHVAIVMDGNGRWAKARGLPRPLGHRAGVEAVRRTVRAAGERGVDWLTLFGFSSENWGRPAEEVGELMRLLRFYLSSETAELHRNEVRLRVIGERGRLPDDVVALIEHAERLTAGNQRLNVTVALSYGGRQDIVQAARRLASEVQNGQLNLRDIDADALGRSLWTVGMPDPDLVIRTSGEQRLSNFLLWQSAYAELVFVDTLWPDFGADDLDRAFGEFRRRERRFGASVGSR